MAPEECLAEHREEAPVSGPSGAPSHGLQAQKAGKKRRHVIDEDEEEEEDEHELQPRRKPR